MTKEEFIALVTNATTVIISVLGKTFNIRNNDNETYLIEDTSKNSSLTYSSAFELIEEYMVMNMSLESLTPWMCVTNVA